MSSAAHARCIVSWKAFVRDLSGPVRANCDCHVSLCLLLQVKVADVTKLKDKCESSSRSVTIAEIAQGAACCEPPHPVTAALFCMAMYFLACGGSAACDKIASAGGIPVIVQLLARLPDEKQVVVKWGCWALYQLAVNGSASIKSLILAQPDIIALLRAASTRLRAWRKYDSAAAALKELGV